MCARVHAWARSPEERLADLTRQAQIAGPELRRVIELVIERTRFEDDYGEWLRGELVAVFNRVLDRIVPEIIFGPEATREHARQALNAAALGELLKQAGIDEVRSGIDHWREQLVDLVLRSRDPQGVLDIAGAPDARSVSTTAIRATIEIATDQRLFEANFIAPMQRVMLDQLARSMAGETLDEAAERIRDAVGGEIRDAATQAKQDMAEFDRAVVTFTAAESGVERFMYLGPVDGLLRPFCSHLVNKVFSIQQIARLDNRQTTTSPLYSGGGFNCRHQWSPVSDALIEEERLPIGDDDDIEGANEAAREDD